MQCVVPVVVEALLEMKVKKEEMKVMKAAMMAPMRVKMILQMLEALLEMKVKKEEMKV